MIVPTATEITTVVMIRGYSARPRFSFLSTRDIDREGPG
jgi:hypothetical protein